MSWLPSGSGPAASLAASPSSRASTAGAAPQRTSRAGDDLAAGQLDLGLATVGPHGGDLGAGPQRRAGRARRGGERVRHRAHPAHGHVPVAGAVADDVVEEAAVLRQRGVVGRGEGPDEPVGQHHPADEVVGERRPQRPPERLLDEVVPRRVVARQRAQVGARPQRLRERREEPARDRADAGVEGLPRRVRPGVAGDALQRRARPPRVAGVDEQAAVAARRVGRDPPAPQLEAQAQLPRERAREEADEVAEAREPRVDAGEGALGDRRAAHVVEALEHEHRAAGAGQQRRGDQAVVAAADDDGVPAAAHAAAPVTAGARPAPWPGPGSPRRRG